MFLLVDGLDDSVERKTMLAPYEKALSP